MTRQWTVMAGAAVALGAAALAALPTDAPAQNVELTDWEVPWEKSRPRDPYVDPQGRVWFVGQAGNYVAMLDPTSGQFRRYEIDEGTHPHNLIVDAKGQVWYAGNRNGMIGRLDPATGEVTRYPMPDAAVRDPHTLLFGRDGEIWFTAQQSNYVGRLVPSTGKIDVVKVPTERARPYGIVLDPQGRPWFTEFGTNKVAMVEPSTMRIVEYELPDPKTRARRLAITSDGTVWYGDYSRGYTGRLDPRTGKVTEWQNPGGALSMPYAMASDNRDRVWFAETGVQPNRLVGFDPKSEEFFGETTIDGNPNTVRHMVFHEPTGTLWFGTDAGTIGRAKVSEVELVP